MRGTSFEKLDLTALLDLRTPEKGATRELFMQAVNEVIKHLVPDVVAAYKPYLRVGPSAKGHVSVWDGEPQAARSAFSKRGLDGLQEAWEYAAHEPPCEHCYWSMAVDRLCYHLPRERVQHFFTVLLPVVLDRASYEHPHPDFLTLRALRKLGVLP